MDYDKTIQIIPHSDEQGNLFDKTEYEGEEFKETNIVINLKANTVVSNDL